MNELTEVVTILGGLDTAHILLLIILGVTVQQRSGGSIFSWVLHLVGKTPEQNTDDSKLRDMQHDQNRLLGDLQNHEQDCVKYRKETKRVLSEMTKRMDAVQDLLSAMNKRLK